MENNEKDQTNIENLNFEEATHNKDHHYSDSKFLNKLKRTGGKLAQKGLYASLVLFYALKSPNLPRRSRLIILGALGYFILPIDLIPDFIPLIGLGDDTAVLIAALGRLYGVVDENIKAQAHKKMRDWFGIEDDQN